MDRLQQQMGSVRHRRRSMDSPMMRQALKDAARRFAEACANKESSELGSEPSTGSMQGCAVHVTCCMQASAACRAGRTHAWQLLATWCNLRSLTALLLT